MGGLDGKTFGPRSWRTDLAALGLYAITMTESRLKVFSQLAKPNSVNKYYCHFYASFDWEFTKMFFSMDDELCMHAK